MRGSWVPVSRGQQLLNPGHTLPVPGCRVGWEGGLDPRVPEWRWPRGRLRLGDCSSRPCAGDGRLGWEDTAPDILVRKETTVFIFSRKKTFRRFF